MESKAQKIGTFAKKNRDSEWFRDLMKSHFSGISESLDTNMFCKMFFTSTNDERATAADFLMLLLRPKCCLVHPNKEVRADFIAFAETSENKVYL